MQGAAAELAPKEASYRTRRGLEGKARVGKHTGGRAYGYDKHRTAFRSRRRSFCRCTSGGPMDGAGNGLRAKWVFTSLILAGLVALFGLVYFLVLYAATLRLAVEGLTRLQQRVGSHHDIRFAMRSRLSRRSSPRASSAGSSAHPRARLRDCNNFELPITALGARAPHSPLQRTRRDPREPEDQFQSRTPYAWLQSRSRSSSQIASHCE